MTQGETPPRIEIVPVRADVDEPLSIRLYGFAPGQSVTLRARMRDDRDRRWESWASFAVDAQGTVDVATQPPLAGTYAGADAMGLNWSLALDPDAEERSPFAWAGPEPVILRISAEVEGERVAEAEVERLYVAPRVSRVAVREAGLAGTLFLPAGDGPHPGVIVLGGSSGGLDERQAALLASHGFAALALAYFAFEGLPARLERIPLEYCATALEWLAARREIAGARLAVLGTSRGAELALLLGATFARVGAVVAYAPSAVLWGAVGLDAPAWTYRGEALPRMPNRVTEEESAELFAHEPYVSAPWYDRNLGDAAACAANAIPVERIAGPVLLLSGEDDQMWPSAAMGAMVMERLRANYHAYPDRHLRYPEAGHLISSLITPYLPTTETARRHPAVGHAFAYGGTPAGYARAAAHSWPEVRGFLAASLRRRAGAE